MKFRHHKRPHQPTYKEQKSTGKDPKYVKGIVKEKEKE